MTGRDLILYILENGLENDPVFKDGGFIGFLTPTEVAAKMHVGVATIYAWMDMGFLEYADVNGVLYVPANFKIASKREQK